MCGNTDQTKQQPGICGKTDHAVPPPARRIRWFEPRAECAASRNAILQDLTPLFLSQRSDLFMERRFQDVLKQLSDERIIARVNISDARPYLPENEEFGNEILVHYISFTVI